MVTRAGGRDPGLMNGDPKVVDWDLGLLELDPGLGAWTQDWGLGLGQESRAVLGLGPLCLGPRIRAGRQEPRSGGRDPGPVDPGLVYI